MSTEEKNPAAVSLGRLGGKKGGPARMNKLTSEERKALAQRAANKRWRDYVRNVMFTLGAPTHGKEVLVRNMEDALVKGLRLAHKDGILTSVLPVVLFKLRQRINYLKLMKSAQKAGETRALGFFLELTAELSSDENLLVYATYVNTKLTKSDGEYFFPDDTRSIFSRKVTENHTPALAKKWGFLMNMGMGSFESMFEKHAQ